MIDDFIPTLRTLYAMGWRIWSFTDWPKSGWRVILWTDNEDDPAAGPLMDRDKPRTFKERGGYSKTGTGPTPLFALLDASSEILKPKEMTIDVERMLR